jgi:hypothetical protein
VSDIFHEVEEEVRRERYEQLWKEYGDYVIAAAAFLIIAVAGWQLWRYYEQRAQIRAAGEFGAAMQLLQTGQTPAAAEAFGKLAGDAPGGYAKVSRLEEAGALLAAGRTPDAVKLYGEIASGGDEILAGVARIRLAWVNVDTTPRAQLQTDLAALSDPGSAWNPMAREILAYSDFRNGSTAQALAEYKRLATDKNAPAALHERAAAMANFLSAGGGRDYGTLPRPAPKAPAAATPTTPQGMQPK